MGHCILPNMVSMGGVLMATQKQAVEAILEIVPEMGFFDTLKGFSSVEEAFISIRFLYASARYTYKQITYHLSPVECTSKNFRQVQVLCIGILRNNHIKFITYHTPYEGGTYCERV